MHYDVAIIGAGMSGLAAGIRLAHFGKKVCIFERHYLWGGLNSFYKKQGHRFDSGLHAVTNFVGTTAHGPKLPLVRVSRQLRIPIADFKLEPQGHSEIAFDEATLCFENGLQRLSDEIRARFPDQIDGFVRLCRDSEAYPDSLASSGAPSSARRWLSEYLSDPLLLEMILCPLLFYGSASPRDVDVDQFKILFNSIYREGLGRPRRGVREMLEVLLARFQEAGGELRTKTGIAKLVVADGRVESLLLDSGEVVTAKVVISSAGLVETTRMRSDQSADALAAEAGQLAFVETIFVLDRPVAEVGARSTASVIFFNHGRSFEWSEPASMVDTRSGVISCPGNFAHAEPLPESHLRVTHLASWQRWFPLSGERYQAEKARALIEVRRELTKLMGDFEPAVTYTDAFTPKTVTKWTGHLNGAVYGSPHKRRSGKTDLGNLFITGTDQGMLGIVGSMVSGVTVANAYGMG